MATPTMASHTGKNRSIKPYDEEKARNSYEQERRVLLNSVAESLSKVVEQMVNFNYNLDCATDRSKEVENISQIWMERYREGVPEESQPQTTSSKRHLFREDKRREASSLSLLHRGEIDLL